MKFLNINKIVKTEFDNKTAIKIIENFYYNLKITEKKNKIIKEYLNNDKKFIISKF